MNDHCTEGAIFVPGRRDVQEAIESPPPLRNSHSWSKRTYAIGTEVNTLSMDYKSQLDFGKNKSPFCPIMSSLARLLLERKVLDMRMSCQKHI